MLRIVNTIIADLCAIYLERTLTHYGMTRAAIAHLYCGDISGAMALFFEAPTFCQTVPRVKPCATDTLQLETNNCAYARCTIGIDLLLVPVAGHALVRSRQPRRQ